MLNSTVIKDGYRLSEKRQTRTPAARLEIAMPESEATDRLLIQTRLFHAAYVLAAAVATIGWVWALGYCASSLFDYWPL
jgi:hypothetical protein